MEKLRIVIADDQEIQNRVKVEYLSKYDYIEICGVGENGQEEYELIKDLKPDIVVTDNQMPIMNGTDVIEKVLEDNEIEQKPYFIIVTADTLVEYRQQFKEKRIIGIVNKGMGFDMVNRTIEELLNEEYQIKNMPEEEKQENNKITKDNQNIIEKIKSKFKKE